MTQRETLRVVDDDPQVREMLLDITMPGEDGLPLARLLREHHDLGIILFTGFSDTASDQSPAELGVDGVLNKPIDHRELFETVGGLLAHATARSTTPRQSM